MFSQTYTKCHWYIKKKQAAAGTLTNVFEDIYVYLEAFQLTSNFNFENDTNILELKDNKLIYVKSDNCASARQTFEATRITDVVYVTLQ